MTPSQKLAKHYCVDDLQGATAPASRLTKILESVALGQAISALSLKFLNEKGLISLARLASGEILESEFKLLALTEQKERVGQSTIKNKEIERQKQLQLQIKLAEEEEREKTMWANLRARSIAEDDRRKIDPKYIARQRDASLRMKFGVESFIDNAVAFKHMMSILRKLEREQRLDEDDHVWLATEGREYATEEITHAHHRLEANHFLAEYKHTKDIWQLVNASAQLRKCDSSKEALNHIANVNLEALKQKKLKSALLTTLGGANRDLNQYEEALKCGFQAHDLLPDSFRPCTLIGAIYMETGELSAGHEWYLKAEARGAKIDSIESDINSILGKMSAEKRLATIDRLLQMDPKFYSWLRTKPKPNRRKTL